MANKNQLRRPDRLTGEEQRARVRASRFGLWVHFDGPPEKRVWRLYDRRSGQVLGWFSVRTGRYQVLGRIGQAERWEEVLSLAARV